MAHTTTSEARKAGGIAALARGGKTLHAKRTVDYRSLPSRSVLNRCDSPRMPFRWTINPYRGCEYGCRYCYARYTHEFLELDTASFESRIFAKERVGPLLERDLHRVKPGEAIAIGTATDPYQPAEKRYRRTHAILETLLGWQGLDVTITTKSNLVTRDLDLLAALGDRHTIGVNVTVTTLDRRLARALEPKAPRPDLRLKAISELAARGIAVGIFVAPVLPDITDDAAALDAVAAAAAGAGATWLMTNPLFLAPSAQAAFFPMLETEYPDLVDRYRDRYGRNVYLPDSYARGLAAYARSLMARHGLSARRTARDAPGPISGPQLSLFQ